MTRRRGPRIRVDGERALYAMEALSRQRLTVRQHGRLRDDTGYQIRTYEGPVINLYDTGTITVTGNYPRLVTDRDSLRVPHDDDRLI